MSPKVNSWVVYLINHVLDCAELDRRSLSIDRAIVQPSDDLMEKANYFCQVPPDIP